MNVFKCKFMGTPAEILVSVLLACSKHSDSGAVLLLPRFYFFALLFTSHRSPLSEHLEQATVLLALVRFVGT